MDTKFQKNSISLFVLLLVGSFCNFLFQVIMGKIMPVNDYGVVNSLLSWAILLALPTSVIATITVKYIAISMAQNDKSKTQTIMALMIELSLLIAFIVLLLGCIFSPFMRRITGIENVQYMFIAVIVAVASLLVTPLMAALQGLHRFVAYGINNIVLSGAKLVFSIIAVYLGTGVSGVIFACVLSTCCGILWCASQLKKELSHLKKVPLSELSKLDNWSGYLIGTIVAQLCISAMTNYDTILVKLFFSANFTGLYAAASSIGKIVSYLTSALVAVLLPMVAKKAESGESTKPMLSQSLLYGGIASIFCIVGFWIFGKWAIMFLFGTRYLGAEKLLPIIGIYFIPITMLTIIMNYLLACGKIQHFAISMMLALLFSGIGAYLFHNTIPQMIFAMTISVCVAVAYNLIVIYRAKQSE
ncbi:MAG: oligosaccharide flippase family protein [Ruthenibacterium sp.]